MQNEEEKLKNTLSKKYLEYKKYNNYLVNLKGFKNLIEQYTIADLETMIRIKDCPSGACSYPAVQTLISLMEILGKIIDPFIDYQCAFTVTFNKLGEKYNKNGLAGFVYKHFRHGIAHSSLAKGGVFVKKSGDKNFHLAKNGQYLDIKIMFEDYMEFHEKFFNELMDKNNYLKFSNNLKKVFEQLDIEWDPRDELVKSLEDSLQEAMIATACASTTTISGMKSSGDIYIAASSSATIREFEEKRNAK